MDFTNNHGAGYGESVWKSLPIDISRMMVLSTPSIGHLGLHQKKEIDYFLALNGINMPLAIVGTEAVWYDASKAIEFFTKDALVFFLLVKKGINSNHPFGFGVLTCNR